MERPPSPQARSRADANVNTVSYAASSTLPVTDTKSERNGVSGPSSRRGSRVNWSLWPLKASATGSSTQHIQSPQQQQQQQRRQQAGKTTVGVRSATIQTSHPSSAQFGNVYPSSNSPSPPSPFGRGFQSDSSPPSTPPDGATDVSHPYPTRFSLDSSPKNAKSAAKQEPVASFASLSPSSSRNDIFSSPVASPVPAPRIQRSGSTASARRSSLSKSTSNFGSPSVTSPTTSVQSQPASGWDATSNRPSYGRSSMAEREMERARIQRNNAEVDFRLCPTKEYLLGEGRHCTVYLGAYRTKGIDKCVEAQDKAVWTLCAIKRLHADRQSQLLGLEEAFALRRLGPHPNIVKLISIRDEVELAATSPLPMTGERSWSGVALPSTPSRGAEKYEPLYGALGKGLPSVSAATAHGRSTSESQSDALPEKASAHPLTHRRQASTPTRGPVVMVASPDGEESFASPIALSWEDVSREKDNTDPPRLLMMLELLPYNLSSFARKNPDRVDLAQWKRWACDLAGVVEWMHAKGCVHADLKPENVLLTSADLTVKICDFNSALFPTPNTPLTDGFGLGTPAYGAPELASSSKGFSFPVDIWSLGAILYTLATGEEPFQKARSMIDILHRKSRFFETEENDRIAALNVAEGRASSANGGSTTASRNGSLRDKKKGARSEYSSGAATSRPTHAFHRENSSDSVSSLASSVMLSGSSGRNPSYRAISMLLDPSPPLGVFIPPGAQITSLQHRRLSQHEASPSKRVAQIPVSNRPPTISVVGNPVPTSNNHGHHRASSLGKVQSGSLLSPHSAASKRGQVVRPTELRRTTSYGGADPGETSVNDGIGNSIATPLDEHPPSQVEEIVNGAASDADTLRLAVTAAFAQCNRLAQHEKQANLYELEDKGEDGARPYQDGSPAILLPGGGRLPEEARNLLQEMLSTDADRRPTATQVREHLEML